MKFKVFNEDKLTLLGLDSVALIINELLENHIQEFAHALATIDEIEDLKEEIQFEKDYEYPNDFEYILYHLVMFGTTVLKYNATDYVVRKKFFGGYAEDTFKAFSYVGGLENGVYNFRQKGNLNNIREIKVEKKGDNLNYYYGEPLSKVPLPYFHEYGDSSLNLIALKFAQNIAYLRKPKNPEIAIGVFNEKAKEIVPLAHRILRHFFVE